MGKRVRICCRAMNARTSAVSPSRSTRLLRSLALVGDPRGHLRVHGLRSPPRDAGAGEPLRGSGVRAWRRRPTGRPRWPTTPRPRRSTSRAASDHGSRPASSTRPSACKGRPPTAALPPLNVALVLDRSGSMHGDPFRNMLLAAETFIGQLRDGDRLSLVAFSDGVYLADPAVGDRSQQPQLRHRQHPLAGRRRRHELLGRPASRAWPRCSARSSPGRSTRSSCSPTDSPTSASPARTS